MTKWTVARPLAGIGPPLDWPPAWFPLPPDEPPEEAMPAVDPIGPEVAGEP
jgi:hypothetical protein